MPSPPGPPPSLAAILPGARHAFADRFGRPPTLLAWAPGRVNLIGEHTDYNGGFVLPMAIDRQVLVLAAPRAASDSDTGDLRAFSLALPGQVTLPLPVGQPSDQFAARLRQALAEGPQPAWGRYLAGVLAELAAAAGPGWRVPALDLLVSSDLPLGGGLSSSAALEVATSTLLEAATGIDLSTLERARLCQRAEQRWSGVPCGIMDQLVATAAQPGAALLIDCQSETFQAIALPPQVAVLITSAQVAHALDDGAYARRTAECAAAARALGVPTLRQADGSLLRAHQGGMNPVQVARAHHVISENQRTLTFAQALQNADLDALGPLLYDSHRSLRDDFQVSCPELDALVDLAAQLGPPAGVLGARLTGGGFGGSTVTLVRHHQAQAVATALVAGFADRTGLRTTCFIATPSGAAGWCQP